jgi:hypothetical protein
MRWIEAYSLAESAAREVATCRAAVRCEQRVADERGVADHVRDAVVRVARRREHAHADGTQWQDVAVVDEPVELRTVRAKRFIETEQPLKALLDADDATTDHELGTEHIVQVPAGAQVIACA